MKSKSKILNLDLYQFLLVIMVLFTVMSCEKESTVTSSIEEATIVTVTDTDGSVSSRGSNKVDVCHNGNIININVNAVPAHQAHGDAVDMDGDGYFDMANDCTTGVDCNDLNETINPGATELCENSIDDDCDGLTDCDDPDCSEGCSDCPCWDLPNLSNLIEGSAFITIYATNGEPDEYGNCLNYTYPIYFIEGTYNPGNVLWRVSRFEDEIGLGISFTYGETECTRHVGVDMTQEQFMNCPFSSENGEYAIPACGEDGDFFARRYCPCPCEDCDEY